MKQLRIIGFYFILLFGLIFNLANANILENDVSKPHVSQDDLYNIIEEINSREDLNEVQKKNALSIYRNALENLRNYEWYEFLTTTYRDAIENSPSKIKAEQEKIDALQKKIKAEKPLLFQNLSILELEQKQAIEKARLKNLDLQIAKIEKNLSNEELRLQEIRQQSELSKQNLETAQRNLVQLNHLKETPLERKGRQLQLETTIAQLSSELKMLDLEAMSHPVRLQLLKTQSQYLNLQRQVLLPVVIEIEKTLAEKKRLEAEDLENQLLETEQQSVDKHFAIQLLAKENIAYTKSLQALAEKIAKTNILIEKLAAQVLEIETDFQSAEKKISLAGLSPALGKILREQRRKLIPNKFSKINKYVQDETALVSLEQFKVETKLKEQTNIDNKIDELLKNKINSSEYEALRKDVRQLLQTQNQILDKLIKNYSVYLRSLGDYEFERQQVIKYASEYAKYLDKHLLWVPSSEPLNKKFLIELYDSLLWVASPYNWKLVFQDLIRALVNHYFFTLLAFIAIFLLFFLRVQIKNRLSNLNKCVSGFYSDKFIYTAYAFFYTALLVFPIPFIFVFLSKILLIDSYIADFSYNFAKALFDACVPLIFLQFFYYIFSEDSIVEKHFNWTKASTQLVFKQLKWLRFAAPIAIFVLSLSGYSKITFHSDSLGRFSLILTMLFMFFTLVYIFRPKNALIAEVIEKHPDGWLSKLRYLWYLVAILSPLIVIGFAATGYYLSALELQQKLISSLRLFFIFLIIYQLVLRWLNLAERHLALQNARQKREAAQNVNADITIPNPEDMLIDIPKVNEQTRNVLNIGVFLGFVIALWMTWQDIFPAFSFLDNIVLWQSVEVIDNQQIIHPITLVNLLFSGLYLFITISAVSNFSGVMEVVVFRRWAVEQGSRYAINQLTHYVIIAVGIICIADQLGSNWSQVQWLIAALSVGLGFGLQEIFANFVSGIILLSERPIRMGDTVTVGDISGKVTKIQMRATHILDWDKKELIIPNKAFITDQLVNWTLSDQMTRVVIPLGVAYGSDTELTQQIVMDVVKSEELILTDPEPSVLFLGFGDSSLDFSIRVYVAELGDRLTVTHNLHTKIHKALAEHNIEIPFPQRDIHIRSGSL